MNNDTTILSDEELAKLVADGDSDKFGVLMERYQAKLFRYGKKFLSDSDNIEDVVQDVFIKTYQNIKSFDTTQRFSPWIYRIAHNTYINAIKKILVLYYIEDFSYKEIADILHIPMGTVGVRIMRAKDILKEKYKELNIEM